MEPINTLWFEGRLGYMERLSIATALAQGHPVTIFSYRPETLEGVPDGVQVRNAAEVMNDRRRVCLFEGKFKALGSDFFRYELFAQQLGYWMDLDVILLRPLDFASEYVFGWEHDTSINGAILKLPANSGMLEELRNIPAKNWLPPFFGPRRTLGYWWMKLRKREVMLEDLPWGVAGPAMITYLARKYDKLESAQPRPVFYPLPYERALDLFDDAEIVEATLAPETRAIHMWHSRLSDWYDRRPPKGSYMDKACRAFDI